MPNDPYEKLAPVPKLAVRAPFTNGDTLPDANVAPSHGGQGRSPALEWDAVDGAAAYLVTCYDPDAPTMSGFWHWVVYNIPGGVTSLPEGAGTGDEVDLPEGAKAGFNETLGREYRGAAPPAGHGPHRYFFTVSALDATLDIPDNLTGARVNFMAREHVIARGHVHAVFENTGA
ncbi:hypothetical protein GCM10011490_05740 [Pseudoclavibacter endophyticus]|uniref:YbhB/YbcL family Raf kinase inhibitor-like protein n=1 Tax=Pseudoclavibacter endophyticus TaxID=1778590 RepID=A0A6H9WG49_9MICO|nr:YbhB/YbcL family Raf kinase inhibitor-like protein [Pseudoclavibacter endophyticus]KAB1649929.1 YbhB/YbcL family Raf kinase inhibitor-like protein [Pseudoclavibacter endophyticus]GGA58647.1 hypothetical protein GCM10011490_05740 [Pseudoclavibacter endophyticus]